ncbi:hypothetical protein O3796_00525 [Granulicatella adiacens]|uniref:hypothetical protein n=1 Tax=Granulicatella adiacens TaxID=46124 RepID=UPI00352E0ACD
MLRQNLNNYFSGLMDNEEIIKKDIEKSMITNFLAPLKIREKEELKNKQVKKMIKESRAAKSNMKKIVSEIDSSIKGAYSKKVVETLNNKIEEYKTEPFSRTTNFKGL